MKIDRSTALALVAAFAIGYWYAGSHELPSPLKPTDRPVLRWIARAAKSFLWIALVAEPAPTEPHHDQRLVQAPAIGDDGYPVVDHARGW